MMVKVDPFSEARSFMPEELSRVLRRDADSGVGGLCGVPKRLHGDAIAGLSWRQPSPEQKRVEGVWRVCLYLTETAPGLLEEGSPSPIQAIERLTVEAAGNQQRRAGRPGYGPQEMERMRA